MQPVVQNETATAAGSAVLKGQGKAGQGSLFAKLMAVFGKALEADAAKAGKHATVLDGKGLAKQQKGVLVAAQGKTLKATDGKSALLGHQSLSKDKKEGDKSGVQQVALIPHQPIQHEAKSVAKGANIKTVASDAEGTADKGKQPKALFQMDKAHLAKTANRVAGNRVALQESDEKDHEAGVAAKRTTQTADAEKHLSSMMQKADADEAAAASNVSDKVHQSKSAVTGQKVAHVAQGVASQETESDNHEEAAMAASKNRNRAVTAKTHAKSSAEATQGKAVQSKEGLHPSAEAVMRQAAEKAAEATAGQQRKAHMKLEEAHQKGKKAEKNIAVASQAQLQAGKPASPVAAQNHAMPRNVQEMLASAGHISVEQSLQGDAGMDDAGQQVQNLGGSTNSPLPVSDTNMGSASAIPRAYTSGAPAGAHTGPWTAMMAMQEIGQQAAQGKTRIELKLEPAHLGKIQVFLDSDSRKHIQVHMVVDQAAARQVIEQHLPSLRHTLEQQGLNLGSFSMSSQHQQHNAEGGWRQQNFTASTLDERGAASVETSPAQASVARANPFDDNRLSIRI